MPISDKALASMELFQNVDPASISAWLDQCEVRDFDRGALILAPDTDNELMYIILDGIVSVRVETLDNPPIATAGQGQCIGEMSVFDGKNPSAFVRAETRLETLLIRRDALLNMIDHSHGVARNLFYILSNRLRSGYKALVDSQQRQREFEQHAHVDVLTGLHNRRWITTYFNRLLKRSEFSGQPPELSVIMIDVDHFKQFNDEYGHVAGDHALRCVADALKDRVRPTDVVARYGGEEFIALLPGTTEANAFKVAERIRTGIASSPIERGDVRYPSLSVSLGVAELVPESGLHAVIEAADKALYEAKHAGRNQTRRATPGAQAPGPDDTQPRG
jgi:diguanylate cyclase (GGDEF)-like protein